MQIDGSLQKLPKGIRIFLASFVIVLSIGFYTGLIFVDQTESTFPAGIEENYLGNEDSQETRVMKFKKSEREILTIVHSHVLSMSFVFLLLGILVWMARLPVGWKLFLTIEPFASVILTFGGIYMLWLEVFWMKYIVLFSGILMTLTFVVSSIIVLFQLLKPRS